MTEMVERVARALRVADLGPTAASEDHDVDWRAWEPDARAAIAAMREPTKAMAEAGIAKKDDCIDSDWDSGPDGESHNSYDTLRSDAPSIIWQAMITAALAENGQ